MSDIQVTLPEISTAPPTRAELKLILSLIDLTSLEGTDNAETIINLCDKARKFGTAAVCVYPIFAITAKTALQHSPIKVASVAGAFPSGQLPLALRLKEAEYALSHGADEIDMVISRGEFLSGNYTAVSEEISAFKKLCNTKTLKIILETGELKTPENIRLASKIAIDSGGDFIKTSTGKIPVSATPEAVHTMLLAIKKSDKNVGIKPSGGISDTTSALTYLRLTEKILGAEWLNPARFRFGASRLAEHIYIQL